MDFDGCRDKKSALGTAAVIVMDKSADMSKPWRASLISTSTKAAASARRAARAWAGCGACSNAWPKAARKSARSIC